MFIFELFGLGEALMIFYLYTGGFNNQPGPFSSFLFDEDFSIS